MNRIRAPCAPRRSETENFPQPRPWRPSSIAESPDKTSSGQGSSFDQTSEGSE